MASLRGACRALAPRRALAWVREPAHAHRALGLGLSVLLFIGASGLFAGIAEDVLNGDPLVALDLQITQWFHAHATAGLTRWMLAVTRVHATLGMTVLGAAFGAFLAWQRQRRWLLCLAVVLPGGMLVNLLLKQIFQRQRPSFDDPLLSLATYSFPSGHVTAATLFYGVLAAFLASRLPRSGRRWAVWAGATCAVALVGLTRVYLGAHYFSDVVAAAAWSTAWLVLWLTLLDPGGLRPGSGARGAF